MYDSTNNKIFENVKITISNDKWTAISLQETENFTLTLVSLSYGDDNLPWIEDNLKEIDDIFKVYKFINPKDIQTLL
jgi:hypothetical protein